MNFIMEKLSPRSKKNEHANFSSNLRYTQLNAAYDEGDVTLHNPQMEHTLHTAQTEHTVHHAQAEHTVHTAAQMGQRPAVEQNAAEQVSPRSTAQEYVASEWNSGRGIGLRTDWGTLRK